MLTLLWFASMFSWVLFTTKTIDNQTPIFNISSLLHFIFAFSSGLGLAIVYQVTEGDLMNMGLILGSSYLLYHLLAYLYSDF